MTHAEMEITQALDRLSDLLTAYHTLDFIRNRTSKGSRAYAVADILAASMARHDIPRASARADYLVREYLDSEGWE